VAHQLGVFERALKYLLNIQVGHPVRRLNWTMTINPRLDTSSETFHEWGHERGLVTPENVDAFMAAVSGPATPVPEMVELFRRVAPWETDAASTGR